MLLRSRDALRRLVRVSAGCMRRRATGTAIGSRWRTGMDSDRIGRRVKWQAAALAVVLAADGFVAYAFGAPAWLAVLYLLLGVALAGGRVWLARRRAAGREPAEPAPQPPPAPEPRRAIGYALVDAPANGQLAAQVNAIEACCRDRDLTLVSLVHDVERDTGSDARPSLIWALEQLAERTAHVLVTPRLRDLARNVAGLPPLLRWFDERDRRLIAIDLDVDTATEEGRLAGAAGAGVGGRGAQAL